MNYRIEYPIYIDCPLQCPYCFSADDFRQGRLCGPGFTLDEYKRWRDKHLADAEDIVMHLHGGEPSTPLNVRYIERLLPELGSERIDVLSNGLGEPDAYRRILAAARQVHRVGFTYHRRMIGGNEAQTLKFVTNVLAVRDQGFPVYVKELLFLDTKADTLRARDKWHARGVPFKVQDFKGTVRGEDFSEFTRYTAEDMELLSPEYVHEGAECACLAGYKNVIIRGGWRSGDVLACWIDPCVVGNISDGTYNPDYRVCLHPETKEIKVEGVPEVYRGTYARDRYYDSLKDQAATPGTEGRMDRQMRRRDVEDLAKRVNAVLRMDQARDFEIQYALVRTKAKLKPIFEEITEMRRELSKTLRETAAKHGKPDAGGTLCMPMPGADLAFDEATDALNDKLRTYLHEQVPVEIYGIPRKAIDGKKLTGTELEVYEELALD